MLEILTLPWVIPTICGCSVAIVAIVAHAASEAFRSTAEANLKRSMVEQGMSPVEIEQILHDSRSHDSAPTKPPKDAACEPQSSKDSSGKIVAGSSLGFGAVLAIVMSWTAYQSIIWAVLHGLLGWIFVVYFLFTHYGWSWW